MARAWKTVAVHLTFGLSIGVLLLSAIRVGTKTAAADVLPGGAITDTTVRLHAGDIAASCWEGADDDHARLTVAMEVGIDGKIRYATATGGSSTLPACVENHVKAWAFLTQDHAQTMAIPVEVDRR